MQCGAGGDGDEDQAVLAGRPQRSDSDEIMEIGWPTDVRHVAHVTFDRFHGFRGVPEELLQQQQPGAVVDVVDGVVRAPSASKTVFGVSTDSMQCAYDGRGNSVPTVLLHLQRRLYDQGGLREEGIFRVAAHGAQVRQHVSCVRYVNTAGLVATGRGAAYGRRGVVAFDAIDDARFGHADEFRCVDLRARRLFVRRTRLLCRKCGAGLGFGYDDHGDGGRPPRYDIKIRALQPLATDDDDEPDAAPPSDA